MALARALTIRPSVVLLDEPFGSLDASLRTGLRRDVARVLAETSATTVLVTHDQSEALALADQVAVLRQGRMVACADPHDLYRDPPDVTVATSIGEANILPADVYQNQAHCVLGTVRLHANGPVADGPAQLLLRPEQLALHLEMRNAAVGAVVVDAQFHGHDTLVDVMIEDPHRQALLARVPGDLVLAPGQQVWVEVQGLGRVLSAEGYDVSVKPSLWIPDPPAAPGHRSVVPRFSGEGFSGEGRDFESSGIGGERLGKSKGPTPHRRRYLRVIVGLVSLTVAVVVALLLLNGGSSPSAIGPVVFHGSISITGEIHFSEQFTDPTTAKGERSCTSVAKKGDQPPNTWQVPAPPLTTAAAFASDADVEIGTSTGGYHGPGRYPQSGLGKGDASMEITETYFFWDPDATVSMTVRSDGSGAVTFSHVPSDDDRPTRGWHGGIAGTIAWTCTS